MKRVKDYMTKRVAYLRPSDTVFKAAKMFYERGISGAPVVDSARTKKVVGVVSESDIVKFMNIKFCDTKEVAGDFTYQSMTLMFIHLLRTGKKFLGFKKEIERISKIKILDVMSKRVVSALPDDNVFYAAEKMDSHDVNRLPIVDDKGKLVGILTRADLVKVLVG